MESPDKPTNKRKRRAKRGDISTLVRIDSPDDAEIAAPPGEGDSDTLVGIDNPDDAEFCPHRRSRQHPQK